MRSIEVIEHGPRPPLVILRGTRMRVLDGWGFMRALQRLGLGLCGVVMTAASDARRWAREIRAHGVLAKPFELDQLLDAVQCFRGGLARPELESRLA